MVQRIALIATGILVASGTTGLIFAGPPNAQVSPNPVRLSSEIELLAPRDAGKPKSADRGSAGLSTASATPKAKSGFSLSSPRTIMRTAFAQLFPAPEEAPIPATPTAIPEASATIPPPPSCEPDEPIRVPEPTPASPDLTQTPANISPETIFEQQFVESCLPPSGDCIDQVVPQTNRKWARFRFPTLNSLFKK